MNQLEQLESEACEDGIKVVDYSFDSPNIKGANQQLLIAHRGRNHEEEQDHEDHVRKRCRRDRGQTFAALLFHYCHYFFPPTLRGSASEIFSGTALVNIFR